MANEHSGTSGEQRESKARRRDAAATRAAILASAIAAFARHGYDGIGVREIAQDAGVTAMLVNRYFGSKEQLFAEAVDTSFAPRTVIPEDPPALARELARRLVARTAPGAETLDPFLLMLRSAANPRAAEIITQGIERHAGRALANLLDGDAAAQRAMLANALIAGVWLFRTVLGVDALARADPAELTVRIERMLAAVLNVPGEEA
ncbi:TetR family transcriptional regulator [Acrocarpospora phusangensis]|uniref:TetR family transcriptional regulator n=1 Tax=Acrocarpospora phusangensis TaxID=1070424 RepID=A0A919QI56_9ACTN|nr:TetR/AcrR family transcriptional regulator [Acrocarpospora phusangensis]GIH28449.1 TetR family transcriptional regulator [Acrocarpospora phusangensis]